MSVSRPCIVFIYLSSSSQVIGWLRRLVLGSSADSPSEVVTNCALLSKNVELLTREEW